MNAVDRAYADLADRIADDVRRVEPRLVDIRRDLHAHPELGFDVFRTADVVAAELTSLGIPARERVGRSGVVAEIRGARPGKCLIIRADMDALPINETTGLSYASRTPGLMHACGHDIHTATLIGVAAVLQGLVPQLRGTVRLMFQPAEEISTSGALAMIEDGVLQGVDLAIGFHNSPSIPVGMFGYTRGASMAAADNFVVDVHGRSGHASSPHVAIDPIIAVAHILTQLQTVVSREIDPALGAALTVAHIQGGTADNIIPDSCRFGGTIRSRSPEMRGAAEAAFRRILAGAEATFRVRCELAWRRGVPAVMNDEETLDTVIAAVREQCGPVIAACKPSFASEDFAYISDLVPSAHLHIGSGAPGRADSLHNSDYQPDEACIGFGVSALVRSALKMGLETRAADGQRRREL